MQLIDYHIHSKCSDDGHNTMLEMALASRERGVTKLCFTDHCDLDSHYTGEPDPDCYHYRDASLKMYEEVLAAAPKDMEISLGMELGEGNHDPERAREIAASPELDFVLSSLHQLRNELDFYYIKYQDEAHSRRLIDAYFEELIELSAMDFYDTMAHVGYPVRYIRRAGFFFELDTKTYGDQLRAMFKNLIEGGRGIEINCSGFRNSLIENSIPLPEVLKLYRELGGEIITIGSDAHTTKDAGGGLTEGLSLLRDLGYRYVTVYRKRKPTFIKI